MSANLRKYVKAVYGLDAVVNRVGDDQWDDPSPCEGWAARDVVGHSIRMLGVVLHAAGGPEVPQQGDAELAGDDPRAAWHSALDLTLEALDTQGALQKQAQTPFGEMTLNRFLGIFAIDPLTHTWDLAVATGQKPVLDEELCRQGIVQLERAGDSVRVDGVFGPPVEPPPDADIVTRFAAFSGRRV